MGVPSLLGFDADDERAIRPNVRADGEVGKPDAPQPAGIRGGGVGVPLLGMEQHTHRSEQGACRRGPFLVRHPVHHRDPSTRCERHPDAPEQITGLPRPQFVDIAGQDGQVELLRAQRHLALVPRQEGVLRLDPMPPDIRPGDGDVLV
jgi:hypothetical protein